jgi:hypothetical protein
MALKGLKFHNNGIEGITILTGNCSKGKLVILLFRQAQTNGMLTKGNKL